jgi:asparagine synthase (glutamine-hydrolysing)
MHIMTAILGGLGIDRLVLHALQSHLIHHGGCVEAAEIAEAALVTIGVRPGRLFAADDLLAGFAGSPVLAGKPIEDAKELALAYRTGQLEDPTLLNGHFAIAIIDRRRDRAVFLRDAIGVNPLYWTRVKAGFAFSTEYKSLRAIPGFDRSLDMDAIRSFERRGWVPPGATFFSSVRPVAPGRITCVQTSDAAFSLTVTGDRNPREPTSHVTAEILLNHIQAAVSRSVGNDGRAPGIMLSSGVDSAVIAALVSTARGTGPVHAFTVGHRHADPEIVGATATAGMLGLIHHVLVLDPDDMTQWLPDCLWTMENPGGRDEYPCLFALCSLARAHVAVLYSGNLSDTLFAGMQSHIDLWHRLKGHAVDRRETPAQRSILKEPVPMQAAPPARSDFRSLREELVATMRWRDERMGAQAMLAARFGIDLRMPFADRNLVDLALRIADDQKVGPQGGKRILREAAALILPRSIARRPKRIQSLAHDEAMRSWLLGMFDRLLMRQGDRIRDFYDRERLAEIRAALCDGLTTDSFDRAWTAISIEIWMRLFLDETAFARIVSGRSTAAKEIASPGRC